MKVKQFYKYEKQTNKATHFII